MRRPSAPDPPARTTFIRTASLALAEHAVLQYSWCQERSRNASLRNDSGAIMRRLIEGKSFVVTRNAHRSATR